MILLAYITSAVALGLEGNSVNMKKPNLVSLHRHSKAVNFTDQIKNIIFTTHIHNGYHLQHKVEDPGLVKNMIVH